MIVKIYLPVESSRIFSPSSKKLLCQKPYECNVETLSKAASQSWYPSNKYPEKDRNEVYFQLCDCTGRVLST